MTSISSKHYSPGDVIEVCEPFVHSLSFECKRIYCDNCLANNQSLKKCSICEQMFYCDRNCQLNDWKCHKLECSLFAKYKQRIKAFVAEVKDCNYVLLLRLYLLLNKYPNLSTKMYSLSNGTERCFNDLLSHENRLKSSFVGNPNCIKFLALLNAIGITITTKQFYRLLGQISINSFGLHSDDILGRKEIGCGLYIAISVFNHSCDANANYLNLGATMQIRAMTEIEPNDHIFLCYVAIDTPKTERQLQLRLTKCFDCQCVRCVSDRDSQFNYKLLAELCKEYNELKYERDMDKNSVTRTLQRKLNLGEQIITLKKQLYAYYNHNISCDMFVHSMNLLEAMKYGLCGQTRHQVIPFIVSIAEYFKITHGTEHGLYKKFIEIMNSNHIPL